MTTICVKCKHVDDPRYDDKHRCKAYASDILSFVTGKIIEGYALCGNYNTGSCPKFEERKSLLQRIRGLRCTPVKS